MSRRKRKRPGPKRAAALAPVAPVARPGELLPVVDVAEPVPIATLLAKLLPEVSVIVVALAFALIPRLQAPEMREVLTAVVLLEIVFCLAQGTLTDLATRLRKSPPRGLAVALALGGGLVVLANVGGLQELARELGWGLLLGILWSGGERLRELWTMPTAARAEKLRRRALVGGRIELVLAAGAVTMVIAVASYLIDDSGGGFRVIDGYLAWFVAAYFSLTAIDVLRVHRHAFLQRPRSLLRFDPLGIDYLAPL